MGFIRFSSTAPRKMRTTAWGIPDASPPECFPPPTRRVSRHASHLALQPRVDATWASWVFARVEVASPPPGVPDWRAHDSLELPLPDAAPWPHSRSRTLGSRTPHSLLRPGHRRGGGTASAHGHGVEDDPEVARNQRGVRLGASPSPTDRRPYQRSSRLHATSPRRATHARCDPSDRPVPRPARV